jgi:hypothetical protein
MSNQLTVIRCSEISGVLCDSNKEVTYFFLKGGNFICVNTIIIKDAFNIHSEEDMKNFLINCMRENGILTLFNCQVQEVNKPAKKPSIW